MPRFLSNTKCMKKLATSEPLVTAITMAMKMPMPTEIWRLAALTVTTVRTASAPKTMQ